MKQPLLNDDNQSDFFNAKAKHVTAGKTKIPPICPFCEFRETEIDKEGNLLLCETCARELADACDRAHHINCCDW